MSERPRAPGFTLIEVMVAMVIGGMAVAGAAALLSALGDRAQAIVHAGAQVDADANAELMLRGVVANLDLSRDTTSSFAGDPNNATFRSWCDTPAGWLDHCSVRLLFGRQGDAAVLRMEVKGAYSSTIDLRSGFRRGRLRYLVEVDRRSTWVDTWSQVGVPTAVAVIIDADTLLLPVSSSG
jgi:prepilin-type N-terminal cleavage/methylation domain-containing protein